MKKLLCIVALACFFSADAYQLSKAQIAHVVNLFNKQKKEWLSAKKKNAEPTVEKFFYQSIDAIINDKEVLEAIDAIINLSISFNATNDQADEKHVERGIQMYAQCLEPIIKSSKNEEEAQIRVLNLLLILEALGSMAQ